MNNSYLFQDFCLYVELCVTLYSVFCILLVVCYFYHKGVALNFIVQLCTDNKGIMILLLITVQ